MTIKTINKRLELTSVEAVVDEIMSANAKGVLDFSSEADREKLRAFFKSFGDLLVQRLVWDFTKGAEKGIEEVGRLIRDPDYYETVKRRRKREKERYEDHQEKQRADAYMRTHFPTAEERDRERGSLKDALKYHRQRIAVIKQRLITLDGMEGVENDPGEDGELSNLQT